MECLGSNPNAIYNNQHDLTLTQNNFTLSVAAGGTLANNTYTWYRNSSASPYLVATGTNKLNVIATGNYHAVITNSAGPGLTLQSDTVSLTVNSLATDSLALVDFYNEITAGLNWVLTNPVSTWEGVTIVEGRVKGLTVDGLSGTISPSIGNITEMRGIYIDEGNLTGTIPSTIATGKICKTLISLRIILAVLSLMTWADINQSLVLYL